MHQTLLTVPLFLLAFGAALSWPSVHRLLRNCSIEDISPEWLANFSVDAYRPMERLLHEEDFEFLSRQPGFDRALHSKLRRERLAIFRLYLFRMISDFNRLHFAGKTVLAHAGEDQSAVLHQLLWLRLRFALRVVQADVSCQLCRLGLSLSPATGLVAQLEELTSQLSATAPLLAL